MAKEAEAASINRLSGSPEVQCIVKGIRNPHEMYNTLETSLDTARSYIGKQDILCQFRTCQCGGNLRFSTPPPLGFSGGSRQGVYGDTGITEMV